MSIQLYYCNYADCDGEDNDLFVSAETPRQAYGIWAKYYEDTNTTGGGYNNTVRIDEVPAALAKPGPHAWGDIKHVGAFDAATGRRWRGPEPKAR